MKLNKLSATKVQKAGRGCTATAAAYGCRCGRRM